MTKVSQALYDEYKGLADQLASALDNRDQITVTQINAKITAWALVNKVDLTQVVEVDKTPVPADAGVVKPGGWGANPDASKWTVTHMKNPPVEFKVVDDKGVNVATNFKTQAGAQAYIDAHKGIPVPVPCPPGQHKDASGKCVDQFGQRKIFPDKAGGLTVTKADVVYKTRNYASGKPSEPTVELTITVPLDHAQDIEATAEVQMTGMSHNDTIDWKLRGPPHQDGDAKTHAWYCIDQETNGGHGTCFQVERPHPSMHNATSLTTKYFSAPNIAKSTIGWKGIVVNKAPNDVYIACWINVTPADQNGWKKVWDCHDIGQIPEGQITPPTGGNCQIRIDGIIGKPLFSKASVREVAYNEASATAL